MNAIYAFGPFIAYFGLLRLAMPLTGLATAFALSALLVFRSWRRGESIKILELGSLVLFGAMTLYTFATHPSWSIGGIKLVVDGGLTAIAVTSMAIMQPFTMQYARDHVPKEFWNTSRFLQANQLISGAWMLCFALATLCDAAATYVPAIPLWIEVVLSVGGLVAAAWFTLWFKPRAQRWVLAPI